MQVCSSELGSLKKDLKHGFGKFVWPNNDQYIGNWEEDKMNGFGKFVHHEVRSC